MRNVRPSLPPALPVAVGCAGRMALEACHTQARSCVSCPSYSPAHAACTQLAVAQRLTRAAATRGHAAYSIFSQCQRHDLRGPLGRCCE
eukprot:5633955-Prymnesium_polylepis.1